jgi:hypothetical protein
MRMIERRACADAHELRRTDFDDGNSRIILEMRNDMFGHRQNLKSFWSGRAGAGAC